MWAFNGTIEHVGASSRLPNATFASRQEMLRCVDPTEAMKETFRSSNVGDCHSVKPEKIDNQFVFSLRCDFTGPARTVIEVGSDSAYTETNEAAAGKFLKRETVIAHWVDDCDAPKVADYELASVDSRKVPASCPRLIDCRRPASQQALYGRNCKKFFPRAALWFVNLDSVPWDITFFLAAEDFQGSPKGPFATDSPKILDLRLFFCVRGNLTTAAKIRRARSLFP